MSWEGVWAQNVGVVLTTITFSALSYGGMKLFSSRGTNSSGVDLREFGDQSIF